MIDLSLPHGTWSSPPPGLEAARQTGRTPYGDWLTGVFDRWYPVARRETDVRILTQIMVLLAGGRSSVETIGLSPSACLVIDTDGSVEQVDTLRAAGPGEVETGLSVDNDAFDTALWHPGIVARQLGVEALAESCRRCDVHSVCGAGYYPHRYRRGSGFQNPSVYCHDLRRLILHVRDRMETDRSGVTTLAPPTVTPPAWGDVP
jgi:uncharacterized protein